MSSLALVASSDRCPAPELQTTLAQAGQATIPTYAKSLIAPSRLNAALARVRARQALVNARDLYTRTDFSGCVSLLLITEDELGRHLADGQSQTSTESLSLLANVNLWLGVCQWIAGDPQAAALAFRRAAQLPGRPKPDPQLLPPELIAAHKSLMSAAPEQVTCTVEPPLTLEHLEIDGQKPTAESPARSSVEEPVKFHATAGSHYLTINILCGAFDGKCKKLQQQISTEGRRALHLEANPRSCRVAIPVRPAVHQLPCVSQREAQNPEFAATLAQESGATMLLNVSTEDKRLALRLSRPGERAFARQLFSTADPQTSLSATIIRHVQLILSQDPLPAPRAAEQTWYKQWWGWAFVGSAAALTTAIILGTRQDRVKVVFGQ